MGVNWKVRLRSKEFWLGMVGVLGTLAMGVTQLLGVDFDVTPWSTSVTAIVTGVFGLLALLGVVNDPTVQGLGDSRAAMSREIPTPREAK